MNAYECLNTFVENVKDLALLPDDEINNMFDALVEKLSELEDLPVLDDEAKKIAPRDLFQNFIQYFQRYWLRQVAPKQFPVYLQKERTTNDT